MRKIIRIQTGMLNVWAKLTPDGLSTDGFSDSLV
jgi:hypothetical protein